MAGTVGRRPSQGFPREPDPQGHGPVPSVEEVLAEIRNLRELVASDPLAAREALRARLGDGRLTVHLDASTQQIWVKGRLIPPGMERPFPANGEAGTAVSTTSSGGWI